MFENSTSIISYKKKEILAKVRKNMAIFAFSKHTEKSFLSKNKSINK
jgi:hypothetical protein